MKKILTVSFVALISVISAGNAAIPDKTYVDDTVDTAVASKVDVAQGVANAFMVTDESGNVVANKELAESLNEFVADVESAMGDIEDAIGVTTNLTTTDKSSLVAAVNEVRDETGSVAAQASELSSKVDSLVEKDSELTALVGTNAEQIEQQGTQIVAHDESITGLGDRLGTAESDISSLKTDKVNKTDLGDLAYQDKLTNNFVDDAAIAQAKVDGLTDALAAKVDKANIITKTGHTYEEIVAKDVAEQDTLVPSFAIMYDMGATLRERILENVSDIETNSGEIDSLKTMVSDNATDIAAKVDKAAVVVSGGTNTMTGATVANDANKDTYVPTVAYAQQMAASAANDAVAGVDVKFQEYVPYAMGEDHADGFVVTDATGNVYVEHGVPASITNAMDEKVSAKLNKPEGECLTPGNCVLVFSGYTEDGEITLVWEKVARSISEVQAE